MLHLPAAGAAAGASFSLAARRRAAAAAPSAAAAAARAPAPRRLGLRPLAAASSDDAAAATAPNDSSTNPAPSTDGDYWAAALWGDSGFGGDANGNSSATAMSTEELKAALLDSFYGTERGLSAGLESRAEIAELLAQLEAANPPPEDPAEALRLLDGEWRLAYTSGSELLAVLALGRLPLVSVGDVTQKIDAARGTFENVAEVSALSGAAGTTRLSARASFEALSARRIAVRFESGGASAPRLSGALPLDLGASLPSSLPLPGGAALDLSPLRPALAPLEEGARAALALAGSLLERAPDLEVPIPGGGAAGAFGASGGGSGGSGGGFGGFGGAGAGARTWLVTTYLDQDLRVSRGDGGGVFVLQRVAPAEAEEGDFSWGAADSASGSGSSSSSGSAATTTTVRGSGAADFDGRSGAGSVSFSPPASPSPAAAVASPADAVAAAAAAFEGAQQAAADAVAEVLDASVVFEPRSSSSSQDPTSSSR
jgi:hypothetical protein